MTDPAEHPILFTGPMVRAILEGRKTQTRRVIRLGKWLDLEDADDRSSALRGCPYGAPGDRLWVREAWMPHTEAGHPTGAIIYRATDNAEPDGDTPLRWRPSIHMPRWASRLTLEVTGMRVERVQDISEEDARAEGVSCGDGQWHRTSDGTAYQQDQHGWYVNDCRHNTPSHAFRALWDSINAKRGYEWARNPWVWVVEFRRIDD